MESQDDLKKITHPSFLINEKLIQFINSNAIASFGQSSNCSAKLYRLTLNFKILCSFKTRKKHFILLSDGDSSWLAPYPLDHWALPKSSKSHIASNAFISLTFPFLTLCWNYVFCMFNIFLFSYLLFNYTSPTCQAAGFKPALTDIPQLRGSRNKL